MGVMGCNRRGCEHILCYRYSHRFGYICSYCFDEMVDSGLPIELFMNKERVPNTAMNYEEEFKLNINDEGEE